MVCLGWFESNWNGLDRSGVLEWTTQNGLDWRPLCWVAPLHRQQISFQPIPDIALNARPFRTKCSCSFPYKEPQHGASNTSVHLISTFCKLQIVHIMLD